MKNWSVSEQSACDDTILTLRAARGLYSLRAMAKTYRPYVPEQDLLRPSSLRNWLPEEHLAFFVNDLVALGSVGHQLFRLCKQLRIRLRCSACQRSSSRSVLSSRIPMADPSGI